MKNSHPIKKRNTTRHTANLVSIVLGDPDGSVVLEMLELVAVLELVVLELLAGPASRRRAGLGSKGVFQRVVMICTKLQPPLRSLVWFSLQDGQDGLSTPICSSLKLASCVRTAGNANISDKRDAKVMQVVRMFFINMAMFSVLSQCWN